ncbi:hypothetical protein COCVIDRAFT_115906, partial [Bipolaris victoriae FI3]
IEGKGKEVKWKNCHVTVIKTDSNRNKHFKSLYGRRDGSLKLYSGMSLYLAGGKFRED